MAKNGLNPTCAQICGYTGVATAWNISANAVGLGYKFAARLRHPFSCANSLITY
jgi:hypothetical protein